MSQPSCAKCLDERLVCVLCEQHPDECECEVWDEEHDGEIEVRRCPCTPRRSSAGRTPA